MEEETRDEIIDIVNNEEPIIEEVKPKSKPKSRAKPKVKITKEPVEPIVVEEAIVEVVEPPKKVDKLKEIVECPDCKMKMTVHTLKYIHKRRGFCKAEVVPEKTPEPIVQQQQQPKPITDDTVNDYIKQNPDIVTNYLRNERILKAQKKQSHARSLLNNAF
jgi:hypothetical protein